MTAIATFRIPAFIYAIALAVSVILTAGCSSPNAAGDECDKTTPRPGKRIVFNTSDTNGVWHVNWCEADSTRYQTLMTPNWFVSSQPRAGRFSAIKAPPLFSGWLGDSLYVIDIVSRRQHFITALPIHRGTAATLSPDGSKVLGFTMPEGQLRIFDVESKTSSLVAEDADWTTPPMFSPDGHLVAYIRFRSNEESLHVVGIDGTGDIRVADSVDRHAGSIAWSPDGRRIAFTRRHLPYRTDVSIVNRDGTGLRTLPAMEMNDYNPQWSPDGSTIALTSAERSGGHGYITLINPDGTGRRRVTTTTDVHEHAVQWSPDGKQLLFISSGFSPSDNGLRTLDLSSGKLMKVAGSVGGRAYWD